MNLFKLCAMTIMLATSFCAAQTFEEFKSNWVERIEAAKTDEPAARRAIYDLYKEMNWDVANMKSPVYAPEYLNDGDLIAQGLTHEDGTALSIDEIRERYHWLNTAKAQFFSEYCHFLSEAY